jgi:hypothetical protein
LAQLATRDSLNTLEPLHPPASASVSPSLNETITPG